MTSAELLKAVNDSGLTPVELTDMLNLLKGQTKLKAIDLQIEALRKERDAAMVPINDKESTLQKDRAVLIAELTVVP